MKSTTLPIEKICSVCKTNSPDLYCGKCGQKYTGKRTSTISLIVDLVSSFFSIERSGFATMFRVLRNPKQIVNNYYQGYSKYYASPGKVLLYGITVAALHITFVDKNIIGLTLEVENFNAQYAFWIFLFPLLVFSSYLTFIRVEKSLSKHLISIIYIATSLFIVCIILNDIITLIWGDVLSANIFPIFISMVYFWNSLVLTTKNMFVFKIINTVLQLLITLTLILLLAWISGNFPTLKT